MLVDLLSYLCGYGDEVKPFALTAHQNSMQNNQKYIKIRLFFLQTCLIGLLNKLKLNEKRTYVMYEQVLTHGFYGFDV